MREMRERVEKWCEGLPISGPALLAFVEAEVAREVRDRDAVWVAAITALDPERIKIVLDRLTDPALIAEVKAIRAAAREE